MIHFKPHATLWYDAGVNRGTHDQSQPAGRASQAFQKAFGAVPTSAAIAPGRVNLIGDHTDYNGGLALPVALDLHAAAAVGLGNPGQIEIVAVDLNERASSVFDSDSIADSSLPAWFAYAGGAAWFASEAMGDAGHPHGLRIALASSVPIGSGLSSSAAIEVAVVTALEELFGNALNPIEKARLCQRVEHRFAGTPSGLLDPLASILGERGSAVLIDFTTLKHELIKIPNEAAFVIIDSGIRHSNADGKYTKTRDRCSETARAMGLSNLTEATQESIHAPSNLLTDWQREAGEHVMCENARVGAFTRALCSGRLSDAGALMLESHRSLSELLCVSTPQIDGLVRTVMEIDGVLGCRMTGGGFGGYLVALLDRSDASAAREQMRHAGSAGAGCPISPMVVEPSDGACRFQV